MLFSSRTVGLFAVLEYDEEDLTGSKALLDVGNVAVVLAQIKSSNLSL